MPQNPDRIAPDPSVHTPLTLGRPFLLMPGAYRIGDLGTSPSDTPIGLIHVGQSRGLSPFVTERWMLTRLLGQSFVVQPLPALRGATPADLRGCLPAQTFGADWVHDPQLTALPEELPPPAGPRQLIEGSWEIWSGPPRLGGPGLKAATPPTPVGRVYVPPALGLVRSEAWAAWAPAIGPNSVDELRFVKVEDGVDNLREFRGWLPPGAREALWTFSYRSL
jgi:hypothetical protein